MAKTQLEYFDLLAAKKAWAEGENVTELLRRQRNSPLNTPEIIEAAYDLQAGSSVDYVEQNPGRAGLYATELAGILERYLTPGGSLLDVGTGELTTLALVTAALSRQRPGRTYAFDISWSRLFRGLPWARRTMGADFARLTPFVANIDEIPLPDKSINVTTSSHALEPNGGRLKSLLAELFRITVDRLVLFEPGYEHASDEGKRRMERPGYIKNVEGVVAGLGGVVLDRIPIKNIDNPLNPTVCFVVAPPDPPAVPDVPVSVGGEAVFSAPGSNYPLQRMGDFYFSNDTGLCYPVLKSVPVCGPGLGAV